MTDDNRYTMTTPKPHDFILSPAQLLAHWNIPHKPDPPEKVDKTFETGHGTVKQAEEMESSQQKTVEQPKEKIESSQQSLSARLEAISVTPDKIHKQPEQEQSVSHGKGRIVPTLAEEKAPVEKINLA